MRLGGKTETLTQPMLFRRAMDVIGGSLLGQLKLHFDDAPENILPPSGRDEPRHALRLRPERGARLRDPVADAQNALDRMERQLRNLRDLLGDDLGLPDSPRAA